MGEWLRIAVWGFASALRSRQDLAFENIALRQQLMLLQRQTGKVRLRDRDRVFWVWLQRVWPGWRRALLLVQPATVVGWHRKGFRTYWRWKSRDTGGRPRIDPSVQRLIRHMWSWNPTWGSPRIQAELQKLGIDVSDATVRRPSQPVGENLPLAGALDDLDLVHAAPPPGDPRLAGPSSARLGSEQSTDRRRSRSWPCRP